MYVDVYIIFIANHYQEKMIKETILSEKEIEFQCKA